MQRPYLFLNVLYIYTLLGFLDSSFPAQVLVEGCARGRDRGEGRREQEDRGAGPLGDAGRTRRCSLDPGGRMEGGSKGLCRRLLYLFLGFFPIAIPI